MVVPPANKTARDVIRPLPIDFGCSTEIAFVGSGPLGKGFQKSTWRAKLDGRPQEVIVKRSLSTTPNATNHGDLDQRFLWALAHEHKWLLSIGPQENIMDLYGICWTKKVFAVEGPLVRFDFVARSKHPWCLSLSLTRQVFDIIEMLRANKLMHCDLKPDQTAITLNGVVKLVDLDTITGLNHMPNQNKECLLSVDCSREAMGCSKNSITTDEICDSGTGQCAMQDYSTLIQIVAKMYFPLLFSPIQRETFSPDLLEDINLLVQMTSFSDRSQRWGINVVRRFLSYLWQKYDAASCMVKNKNAIRNIISSAQQRQFTSAPKRCQNLYC